mgnify:CR=1 FL=1
MPYIRFLLTLGLLLLSLSVLAEEKRETPPTERAQSTSAFLDFAAQVLAEQIPPEYEDEKDWGGTKEIVTGLRFRFEEGRLETYRKRRLVNDGTWTRYRFELKDPAEGFNLKLENLREAGEGKVALDAVLSAHVSTFGRVAQWERGVQLFSLSCEGSARVELRLSGELSLRLDPSKLPPDVLLMPVVTAADLELHEFRVNRVSKVGGEVAEQLGRGMESLLRKKIERSREELAAKLNRKVEQKQDKLRFSLRDLLTSPLRDLGDHIPPAEEAANTEDSE